MLEELSDSPTLIRVQTWDLGAPVPPAFEDALALEWPTTVGVVATSRTDLATIGTVGVVATTRTDLTGAADVAASNRAEGASNTPLDLVRSAPCARVSPHAVACLSPTEWLMIIPASGTDSDTVTLLLRPLQTALQGTPFRATIVTHALARIEVESRDARLLLAKGCSLDLHPSRFSPGRCARTRLAGMPVILWCIQESTFQCIVASSYREYLLAWLADAGLEMEIALS